MPEDKKEEQNKKDKLKKSGNRFWKYPAFADRRKGHSFHS